MTWDKFVSSVIICFFISIQAMSRMAMRKERLRGTGFGSADQPEHWALTDRSKMADGIRCAEFKGAGLELEVLDWLG